MAIKSPCIDVCAFDDKTKLSSKFATPELSVKQN